MTNPDVDRWFAVHPVPWQKAVCERLRALIFQAVPGITEAYHWSIPAYLADGPVCAFYTSKKQVSLAFTHGALLDAPPGLWEEGPDTTKKGKRTLQLREGQIVPDGVIVALVAQAAANNRQGVKVDLSGAKPGSVDYVPSQAWAAFLREAGRLEDYEARPPYQRKGWIQWIEAAKTPATRTSRAQRMLEDLASGQYMPPKSARNGS